MTNTTYPLGRIVRHDERSRGFPAPRATVRRTVTWRFYGPILDQGRVSSCTTTSLAQFLNTRPSHKRGKLYTQADALRWYPRATQLDPFDGTYPPDDTGSSEVAACTAAREEGAVTSYLHAFGLDWALDSLALSPVLVGTAWHEYMFTPDAKGFIAPDGAVVGGHEYMLIGVNLRGQYVTMLNQWGPGWGRNGRAKIRFDALDALLKDDGDVTVPVV